MPTSSQPGEVQPGEMQPGETTDSTPLFSEDEWEGETFVADNYYAVYDQEELG